MLIRVDGVDGKQTETFVPRPDCPDLEDLARGLIAMLPGVARVRLWEDGLGFVGPPTVDVSVGLTPPEDLAHDVADAATALLLTAAGLADAVTDQEPSPWQQPPEWLRPYVAGPGRPPASTRLPPV